MKSLFSHGAFFMLLTCVFCFCVSEVKSQNCNSCKIPSFPSFTVYQTIQTGPGIGFGLEAGTWNKDAGKFSYFFGTSMVWSNSLQTETKSNASQSHVMINFYVKGQYKLAKHLYAIAAPGIGELSYFEFQSGLRYVIPVSHVVALGIEPAYAFHQQQMLMNINLHFALR
jgi:hypothetical protein